MGEDSVVRGIIKTSVGYMMLTAAVGVILGLVMLFYPGGTMAMMAAAFMVFQIILTIFIAYYTLTEAVYHIKAKQTFVGIFFILIGIVGVVLVWLSNISLIYYIIAFFLILTGISDIIGGARLAVGRYFLILLGIINILIAIVILRNPVILPLLFAWYVIFWGVSRLFLSFELRKLVK